ncbi:hypothetical protein NHX12_004663, partial [Muraenolepis orangiensis]
REHSDCSSCTPKFRRERRVASHHRACLKIDTNASCTRVLDLEEHGGRNRDDEPPLLAEPRPHVVAFRTKKSEDEDLASGHLEDPGVLVEHEIGSRLRRWETTSGGGHG